LIDSAFITAARPRYPKYYLKFTGADSAQCLYLNWYLLTFLHSLSLNCSFLSVQLRNFFYQIVIEHKHSATFEGQLNA